MFCEYVSKNVLLVLDVVSALDIESSVFKHRFDEFFMNGIEFVAERH